MKHKEHRAIDKLVLGREYPDVHRFMDKPAYRMGPGHRRFRHDMRAVLYMALKHQDPRAGVSALLHIGADFIPGEMKKMLKQVRK